MAVLRFPERPGKAGPTAADVCADFEPGRLVQARQLAMLSRADIAEAVGVPAWQILHWETAISVPKAYQLVKLAEVTGHIVPFFKRGRPMARLTEADCHFRPSAYGR